MVGGGGGGGEGGTSIAYEYLKKGNSVQIIIGIGGVSDHNGENSKLIVNDHTYIGGGGSAGLRTYGGGLGGHGGAGDIIGESGNTGASTECSYGGAFGGAGGGNGGGSQIGGLSNGTFGSGGQGGEANTYSLGSGFKGGNGVSWIEYFDPKKK